MYQLSIRGEADDSLAQIVHRILKILERLVNGWIIEQGSQSVRLGLRVAPRNGRNRRNERCESELESIHPAMLSVSKAMC